MIKTKHEKIISALAILMILAMAVCLLAGCGAKKNSAEDVAENTADDAEEAAESDESKVITSLEQLSEPGIKIGTGGKDLIEYTTLKEDYPDAEVIVYDDNRQAYKDVASGKIDAYIYSRREMEHAIKNGVEGVRLLDENYSQNSVAVGISPKSGIPDLEKKVNDFIAELKADGTLDEMYTRWFLRDDDGGDGDDGDVKMPEIEMPYDPDVELIVGTTGTVKPYSYLDGEMLTGYDVELAKRFTKWLNASIGADVYEDFDSLVDGAASGEVDCILTDACMPVGKESDLIFSDPLFEVETAAMVRAEE